MLIWDLSSEKTGDIYINLYVGESTSSGVDQQANNHKIKINLVLTKNTASAKCGTHAMIFYLNR